MGDQIKIGTEIKPMCLDEIIITDTRDSVDLESVLCSYLDNNFEEEHLE